MDLYSLVTGLIGQNGRRGALMISIACDWGFRKIYRNKVGLRQR